MQIIKNRFERYDLHGIQDPIPSKRHQGIAGYGKCLGWLLKILGFAFALKDGRNRTVYLNRKSALHWLQRHNRPLPENATINRIIRTIKQVLPPQQVDDEIPEENAVLPWTDELLPKELVGHVASFLPIADLAQFNRVSTFFQLAGTETLFAPHQIAYNLNHFVQQIKRREKKFLQQKKLNSALKYIEGLSARNHLAKANLSLLSTEDKWSILKNLGGLELIWKNINPTLNLEEFPFHDAIQETLKLLAPDFLKQKGLKWLSEHSASQEEFFKNIDFLWHRYFEAMKGQIQQEHLSGLLQLRQENPAFTAQSFRDGILTGVHPLLFVLELAECASIDAMIQLFVAEPPLPLAQPLSLLGILIAFAANISTTIGKEMAIAVLIETLLTPEKQKLFLLAFDNNRHLQATKIFFIVHILKTKNLERKKELWAEILKCHYSDQCLMLSIAILTLKSKEALIGALECIPQGIRPAQRQWYVQALTRGLQTEEQIVTPGLEPAHIDEVVQELGLERIDEPAPTTGNEYDRLFRGFHLG